LPARSGVQNTVVPKDFSAKKAFRLWKAEFFRKSVFFSLSAPLCSGIPKPATHTPIIWRLIQELMHLSIVFIIPYGRETGSHFIDGASEVRQRCLYIFQKAQKNQMITAIEQAVCRQVRERPGCFDGKLLNYYGQPYVQLMHGDNPLAAGFDICSPYSGFDSLDANVKSEAPSRWNGAAVVVGVAFGLGGVLWLLFGKKKECLARNFSCFL